MELDQFYQQVTQQLQMMSGIFSSVQTSVATLHNRMQGVEDSQRETRAMFDTKISNLDSKFDRKIESIEKELRDTQMLAIETNSVTKITSERIGVHATDHKMDLQNIDRKIDDTKREAKIEKERLESKVEQAQKAVDNLTTEKRVLGYAVNPLISVGLAIWTWVRTRS